MGRYIVLALIVLPSFTSAASSQGQALQRHLYQEALNHIASHNWTELDQSKRHLKSYPLFPYLEYAELRARPELLTPQRLDAYAARYQDTPLPPRLSRFWYDYLIEQKRWQTYVQVYNDKIATTSQQCHYWRARYRQGDQKQAFAATPKLWTVAHSQPKACDPLFKVWIDAGHLSSSRALKRFWLAIDRGNLRLARYLQRFLTEAAHRDQAAIALKIYREPDQLAQLLALSAQSEAYPKLVRFGVKRLARKDPEAAAELWLTLKEHDRLSTSLQRSLSHYIGMRLTKRGTENASHFVEQLDPDFQSKNLTAWRARLKLAEQDWHAVESLIQQLPRQSRDSNRWRYWQARALVAQGNTTFANEIYESLAQERSFYGFLAAAYLKQPLSFNHQPLGENRRLQKTLEQRPGLIRARELHWHEQLEAARREWRQESRKFNREEHQASALLAQSWGWHGQAIRSAIAAQQWNDLELRFPLAYAQPITERAAQHGIARDWVFAIARQESAFTPDAGSSAGARGLMQLMPATAKQTARKLGTRYGGHSSLSRPEENIRLGSAYLAQLYERFDGNRVYATAAYNAGPHRVSRWLEKRNQLPADIWIELIPFDETRQYVQNVLSFAAIYAYRRGDTPSFLTPQEALLLAQLQDQPTDAGIADAAEADSKLQTN